MEAKLMDQKLLKRVEINPKIMVGKPVIKGTRIPVELIVRMIAQGIPENDILKEYPRLQPDDIRAALVYAAWILANEDVLPLAVST
jgi:uncharacterized protein (DUF433 family)